MKKLISVLLTLAMVLSLVPAVFAADEPTITLSADKTSVAPGETVTLTLSLDKELVADAVGIAISFDTNAYTLTGRKNLGSRPARLGFTDIDAANNQGAVKSPICKRPLIRMILLIPVLQQVIGHPLPSPQKRVQILPMQNLR